VDPRSAVRRARTQKDRFDAIAEKDVTLPALRRRAIAPRIVAARGDSEIAAQRGDRIFGSMRSHESEGFLGIVMVSRANQAAAFDRISVSIFSRLFSRRNRVSSSRSAVVKPSSRRPSLRSSCFSQFAIVCRERSNSRETSFAFRPERTSSMIDLDPFPWRVEVGHQAAALLRRS